MINCFNFLLAAIPLAILLQWILLPVNSIYGDQFITTPLGPVDLHNMDWTPLLKILGFLSDVMSTAPYLIALITLRSLFRKYLNGSIFSSHNANQFKKLGITALLNALIFAPLSYTLLILATTLSNPPGQRFISIHFGSLNLASIFLGLILIVVSKVMVQATSMHEDQQLTI